MIDPSLLENFLISRPAVYRIRVCGRMDPECSQYFQGMTVSVFEQGAQGTITELSGLLPDQAALMGVLQQLYNRNIAVLSVECVAADSQNRDDR